MSVCQLLKSKMVNDLTMVNNNSTLPLSHVLMLSKPRQYVVSDSGWISQSAVFYRLCLPLVG